MKNWYYFLFYNLYILDRLVKPQWWSEQKAAFYVSVLDFWILLTTYGFIVLLLGDDILDEHTETIAAYVSIGIILVFNWFVFLKGNKFKKIVSEYDRKAKKGGKIKNYNFLILGVVVIFGLFSLMLYMTGKVHGTIE